MLDEREEPQSGNLTGETDGLEAVDSCGGSFEQLRLVTSSAKFDDQCSDAFEEGDPLLDGGRPFATDFRCGEMGGTSSNLEKQEQFVPRSSWRSCGNRLDLEVAVETVNSSDEHSGVLGTNKSFGVKGDKLDIGGGFLKCVRQSFGDTDGYIGRGGVSVLVGFDKILTKGFVSSEDSGVTLHDASDELGIHALAMGPQLGDELDDVTETLSSDIRHRVGKIVTNLGCAGVDAVQDLLLSDVSLGPRESERMGSFLKDDGVEDRPEITISQYPPGFGRKAFRVGKDLVGSLDKRETV